MLGVVPASAFKLPPGTRTYSQASPPDPAVAPAAATTPAWLPWAIGAAVGGGILYLLLRD